MVKNIKIKHFLIISFITILLLMNLLGGLSIFFMQKLAGQSIDFYEGPHTIQKEVDGIELILSEISGEIKNAVIYQTAARTSQTTQYLASSLEDMNKRIAIVKQLSMLDTADLARADSAVEAWLAVNDKLRSLMEAENYSAAITLYENEYLPAEEAVEAAVETINTDAQATAQGYYTSAQRSKVISLYVIIGMLAVTIFLTVLLCRILLKSIAYPLAVIQDAASSIADGDLHQEIDFEGNNEFGQLAGVLKKMTSTLRSYIKDIDRVLSSLSDQDLTVTVDMEYIGDFHSISESMHRIIDSFKEIVRQIENSADQVEAGSQELAATSQVLSQGSSEQAASVQELTASLNEISSHVKENTADTISTNTLVASVGQQLEKGNRQMQDMVEAMSEINASSTQIAKIIKTIEDIAFQTNILALNAAVEAARAGAAGKGFAVVADEVRNLAGKSAEAAESTTELIQNSITAVNNGTSIANDTAQTLLEVVGGAGEITGMVSKISSTLQQQSETISEITQAVGGLNAVIQTNSATAEEISSACEELSGQTIALNALIERFKL